VILMEDSIIEFIKTFLMLFGELLALFIVVSFIVSFIQQVVSEEKIKQFLNRPNKAVNYVLGTFFGAVTPFCSCSTIPILDRKSTRLNSRHVSTSYAVICLKTI